jgi:uncharacterized protein YdeI (YjbR/CyaY-like superfamily)
MKDEVVRMTFETRDDFRAWLSENAEAGNSIWLVFSKTKDLKTLSAHEALEEALCFGWIDGQMKSVDDTRYLKYFARRQSKSVWSEKNKQLVEQLREKKIMTELGEKAVRAAMEKGMWNAPKSAAITDDQLEVLAKKLVGLSPAYENFCNMSPSVRRTYAKRYTSFKSEEAREKDFIKIVDRLNQNLKPM